MLSGEITAPFFGGFFFLPQGESTIKEKICSSRSKFFPLKSRSIHLKIMFYNKQQ